MKKPILYFLFFLISFAIKTQAQQPTFAKVYYTDFDCMQTYSIENTFDNNYLIIGEKNDHALVIKIDSSGSVLWSKASVTKSTLYSIVATHDSCSVLVGRIYNSIDSAYDMLCFKINSAGDTIWSKEIDLGNNDCAYSVDRTNDNGYILAGNTQDSSTSSKIAVAKLDSNGNFLWGKIFAGSNYKNGAYSIKQLPDSSYVLTGYVNDSLWSYYSRPFIIKLTATGNIIWSKTSSDYLSIMGVTASSNGLLYYMSTFDNYSQFIFKSDFSGNIIWSKVINLESTINYSFTMPRLYNTSDSAYILVVNCMDFDHFGYQSRLIKIDTLGSILWSKSIRLYATDITECADKGYLIAGNGPVIDWITKYIPTSKPQIGIIKTDSLGNSSSCVMSSSDSTSIYNINFNSVSFTSTSGGIINNIHLTLSNTFLSTFDGCVEYDILGGFVESLNKKNSYIIYPNPSFDYITIESTLQSQKAKIYIYDLQGRLLFHQWLTQAKVELDVSQLVKGMYIIEINDGNKVTVTKLIKD